MLKYMIWGVFVHIAVVFFVSWASPIALSWGRWEQRHPRRWLCFAYSLREYGFAAGLFARQRRATARLYSLNTPGFSLIASLLLVAL